MLSQLLEDGYSICAADRPGADDLMMRVYAAMAQKERELISERTKAALAAAKARGARLGGDRGYRPAAGPDAGAAAVARRATGSPAGQDGFCLKTPRCRPPWDARRPCYARDAPSYTRRLRTHGKWSVPGAFSPTQRAQLWLASTHAASSAKQAAELMFSAGGSASPYTSTGLERCARHSRGVSACYACAA